jgi:CubicO group peptidase (beta-lactamase class C family)
MSIKDSRGRRAISAAALTLVVASATLVVPGSVAAADGVAGVIARHRAAIPAVMDEEGVPGLAVALVDRDEVLWVEGFGQRGSHDPAPVTVDTAFSVQSISKVFTATAVLVAVEDGRVELDEPITTYLPEFTVHSAFEDHPERRITLRMLLAHTAGFTHEAPVGNNFELQPGDFDAHVRSISDTWLRFPVGSGVAYSNLGIDLAGAVLERVYDRPFTSVMDDLVLEPLGMTHSTFDRAAIRAMGDRALGHYPLLAQVPVDVPMTAAGGLYTSATDLARFLRFQLRDGTFDGRTVLDRASLEMMRTIPPPEAGSDAGFGLGVAITRWRAGGNADLYSHGGAGFGFRADLWWVPELGLGVAVLTNSLDHALQGELALSILRDVAHAPGTVYEQRLAALPVRSGPQEPTDDFRPPSGYPSLVAAAARAAGPSDRARWDAYAGTYRARTWGVMQIVGLPGRFFVVDGTAWFEADEGGGPVSHRLVEIDVGLFLADDGEILDLRGPVPTWRNIELVRSQEQPAPAQWVLVILAAAVAASWPIGALWRAIRAIRRRSVPRHAARWPWFASLVATLTAGLALLQGALLIAMPGVVDSGFLGWLEWPPEQKLAWHVPAALLVVSVVTGLAGVAAWAGRWWSTPVRVHYSAVVGAVAALLAQVAMWGLIGWGY